MATTVVLLPSSGTPFPVATTASSSSSSTRRCLLLPSVPPRRAHRVVASAMILPPLLIQWSSSHDSTTLLLFGLFPHSASLLSPLARARLRWVPGPGIQHLPHQEIWIGAKRSSGRPCSCAPEEKRASWEAKCSYKILRVKKVV
ncbi:uncharacterized protein LOC110429565 isoform X2 [Sorghum bicolor]|uniref:Uncharacterized protein n=1 Tax=Sorghum bicolor TaxID=4558 RepID=A0A1B6PD63_SORBI|nr:uncharacterized protein LOC110429565 isoform X2 [Sorghum bicolor]KXG23618.1 hypothetical protein SORBI_3008G119100 [Sorghum bicolor]|eukprot:XP_021301337.1 uncharacterized protein LOC110429565 isoform X2 [Sorghum bicolor]